MRTTRTRTTRRTRPRRRAPDRSAHDPAMAVAGRRRRRLNGEAAAARPGRAPPLPVQAPDRLGQDHRRRRLRRGRPHDRRPHPHPPPAARRPVHERPHQGGLRRPPARARAARRPHARARRRSRSTPTPGSSSTPTRSSRTSTAWSSATRPTRRSARRRPRPSAAFDEPIYIGMTATDQLLQKHVGDVFPAEVADFPLAEAVRRGVVAPLRCIRVRPDRVAAPGRDRRRRLRPGPAGRRPRPRPAQPGRRRPLPEPVRRHAGDRLRGRRRPRRARRGGDARDRHEGAGGVGPHAAARAGRDARGLRARRDQRARERPDPGRGLERAARDRLHAPRADRQPPRLPAARRPDHAPAPAQGGRASSSTSPRSARRTPSAWSRCTRCSTSTPTGRPASSRRRRRAAAAAGASRRSRSSRNCRGSCRSRTTPSAGSP